MNLSTRTPMIPSPKREKKERSSKIIFFSCEGPVTEEIYFQILSEQLFSDISSQICLVSARKDFLKIPCSERTQMQWDEQNKSSPKYVLERLEKFINENDHLYEFSKHKEDEFWIVIDVDDHIASSKINEFKIVLQQCLAKGIQFAVTNPCFEFWLLMHFEDVRELNDKQLLENPLVTSKRRYTEQELRNRLPKYEKSRYDALTLVKNIDIAIKNEKRYCEDLEKLESAIGSNIGLLICEMRKM